MSDEQTIDICGKSLGIGWWCVKSDGHAPPCIDADETRIERDDSVFIHQGELFHEVCVVAVKGKMK